MYRKLLIICSVFLTMLFATTRHIYEPDGARAIQDSINISSHFDTVMVHCGIYYTRDLGQNGILMRDSVILLSLSYDSVTLSGLNSAGTDTVQHVIYCNWCHPLSFEAVIEGFTIIDGNGAGTWGGGIYCDVFTNPVIRNSKFEKNYAERGGAIACNQASPIIEDNLIINNTAVCGGGIACTGYPWSVATPPVIKNNTISSCSTDIAGGGIYCHSSSFLIEENNISDNYAVGYGGGITVFSCSTAYQYSTIKNNVIKDNISELGGGISCWFSFASAENNTIDRNVGRLGGGIFHNRGSSIFISNTITNNYATECGGAFNSFELSYPYIKHSLFAANIAQIQGGSLYPRHGELIVDSCFFVDNGSLDSTKSGCIHIPYDCDIMSLGYSHLYCNTYQQDIEIDNDEDITMPFENNFWWITDSIMIDSLIEGRINFSPWFNDFITGVPGEPVSVDSVRNYDSLYAITVDSIGGDPDTLYLRLYGMDRNSQFREAAVVLLRSDVYTGGIAVALVESAQASGIYGGKAIVKTSTGSDIIREDDIRQTIRVNTFGDTIKIIANVDTTQQFKVYYRCSPGISEMNEMIGKLQFEVHPNPFTRSTKIRWHITDDRLQTTDNQPQIKIYNSIGQLIEEFNLKSDICDLQSVSWDGTDRANRPLPSGVYFVKLEIDDYQEMGQVLLIK